MIVLRGEKVGRTKFSKWREWAVIADNRREWAEVISVLCRSFPVFYRHITGFGMSQAPRGAVATAVFRPGTCFAKILDVQIAPNNAK